MFQKCCRFLSIPLAVVFFISTTGIALFEHRCNTNQTSNFALFTPVDCDHQFSHNLACCSAEKNKTSSKAQKETNDCCKDIFHFLKANIKSTLSVISTQKIQFPFFAATLHCVFPICKNIFLSLSEINWCAYTPKPPPKAGSFIVILFNKIKIPELLA